MAVVIPLAHPHSISLDFTSRVTEAEVIRVQTAYAHTIGPSIVSCSLSRINRVLSLGSHLSVPGEGIAHYIQGMNCLSGALLLVMPELDAFHCYVRLVKQCVEAVCVCVCVCVCVWYLRG